MPPSPNHQWSSDDLWAALEEFRSELTEAGLRSNSVETYVGRATVFLRWLDGDYQPRGPIKPARGKPE